MLKKILINLNKYKLLIVLLLIISLLVIAKIHSKKESEDNINQNSVNNTMFVENVLRITPTSVIFKEITPTQAIEEDPIEAFLDIKDSFFPYDGETFLAERYENGKIFAKSLIDDKQKAERDLKYWYFVEMEGTLPSTNIVWE